VRQPVELVADAAPTPLAKTYSAWKSRCFAICAEGSDGTTERSEVPRRSSGSVVRPCVLSEARLLRLYTAAPHAAWRHDVDVSLSAAQQMARFAELAGVQTTFYLMPRSDWYNLFGREGAHTLDVIAECGHRLGLHCDHREGSVVATVEADFALVDVAYPGVFARLVSFHAPSPSVLWRDFESFENSYARKWEGRYLSDSRAEWTEEKEALVGDDMQIALHPEHWFAPRADTLVLGHEPQELNELGA